MRHRWQPNNAKDEHPTSEEKIDGSSVRRPHNEDVKAVVQDTLIAEQGHQPP